MTRTHKIEITGQQSGRKFATVQVRDANGDEFAEVAAIRERIFRITGEFPIASWNGSRRS